MRMTEIIGVPMPYNIPEMQQAAGNRTAERQDKADGIGKMNSHESARIQTASETEDKVRKSTALEQVSLTFNKEEAFDYIGIDSSLAGLDVQKAISVMKKDKVLEEYQYFVGGKPDLEYDEDIDGTVFQK